MTNELAQVENENEERNGVLGQVTPLTPEIVDRMELLAHGISMKVQAVFTAPEPDPSDRRAVLAYASQVSQLFGKADLRAADTVNVPILMSHVFVHRARVRQEDGSYIPVDRLVVLAADGTTYEAVSAGLFDSILMLFSLPGIGHPSKWAKPLPIMFKSVPVRNTWRTLKIEVMDHDPDDETYAAESKAKGRK